MPSILDFIPESDLRYFSPGEEIIEQGTRSDVLFFLMEGSVEVVKDGIPVATASLPGAVFGELSVLLGGPHSATVRALRPCIFKVVPEPKAFLQSCPQVCLHVCQLLARRLDSLNTYLVDLQEQYAGKEDQFGMVTGVLEVLMHRTPAARTRPSESTLRRGEFAD